MTLGALWRRSLNTSRRYGFAVFAADALRMVTDRYLNHCLRRVQDYFNGKLDRRYGIDTCGIYFPATMPFSNPNKQFACNYQPTTEYTFRRMMSHIPGPLAGFDFIDVGCGKGRVLFYAVDWPFKRIVGVELAPPLAAFAKRNVALYAAATGDRRLEAHCEDAVDMNVPEGPCVFFFASPFIDPVLTKGVTKIEQSYRANPRKIYVIYYDAKPILDIVGRFGFLRPISRGAVWQDPLALWIYPYIVLESPDGGK